MGERKRIRRINTKVRFEIFKRDSFTCQYCGRSAPKVELEVDHIIPFSLGGETYVDGEIYYSNLITCCSECNTGKGRDLLHDNKVIVNQMKQIEYMEKKKHSCYVHSYYLAQKIIKKFNLSIHENREYLRERIEIILESGVFFTKLDDIVERVKTINGFNRALKKNLPKLTYGAVTAWNGFQLTIS